MNEQFADERVKEYLNNKALYCDFARQMSNILEMIIKEELPNVKIASFSYRAKDEESLRKKLQKDKYTKDSEITDLAGVRIILYSRQDIPLIEKIVKDQFIIDDKNSVNKESGLGNDKVGYRGIHYIVSFDEVRGQMPENKKYRNLKCEVQITSLIAHTWSEITHERGYKFEGQLPDGLERRKNLLAGMLELADLEMDEYVQAFDAYIRQVNEEVEQGGLALSINSMSLEKYMCWKFPDITPQVFRDVDEIIDELGKYGLKTIRELDKLITQEIKARIVGRGWRSSDGIIRNILILNNADNYFSHVWNPNMRQMNKKNYDLYKDFGIAIDDITKDKGIEIVMT